MTPQGLAMILGLAGFGSPPPKKPDDGPLVATMIMAGCVILGLAIFGLYKLMCP